MQMLVNKPPVEAKQILGERLYALKRECCLLVLNSVTSTQQWIRQPEAAWFLIQVEQGLLDGKITGMLLEGLDNSELVTLSLKPLGFIELRSKKHFNFFYFEL